MLIWYQLQPPGKRDRRLTVGTGELESDELDRGQGYGSVQHQPVRQFVLHSASLVIGRRHHLWPRRGLASRSTGDLNLHGRMALNHHLGDV